MADYVPTGGGNDPNTWRTDPGYGQVGANRGAGYNPEYWKDKGGFEAYHAARRAYRDDFKPGGEHYRKYMQVAQALGAARPGSEADVEAVLNRLGYFDAPEQGRSMVRNWKADFNNRVNGELQYDPESGMAYNVATSDVNGRAGRPMTAEDWDYVNRGFQGRLDDMLGAGRYGGLGSHFDAEGYAIDAAGQRTGGRYNGVGGAPRALAPSSFAPPMGDGGMETSSRFPGHPDAEQRAQDWLGRHPIAPGQTMDYTSSPAGPAPLTLGDMVAFKSRRPRPGDAFSPMSPGTLSPPAALTMGDLMTGLRSKRPRPGEFGGNAAAFGGNDQSYDPLTPDDSYLRARRSSGFGG